MQLVSRWRSVPQVAQMFCSRSTIMTRALLNFCGLDVSRTADLRDDKITSPRQQNLPKNHVWVQLESRWRSDPQVAQVFFVLLGQ